MSPESLVMVDEESKVAMMAKEARSSSSSSSDSDGEWRFAYEALQNVRAVQLLLFHPTLSPLEDCPPFTAAMRHGHLRCTWDNAPSSLCVPLPAPCLLDLSQSPRCWTRADHVEVRIGLLSLDPVLCRLGIQHDELPQTDDAQPFSVEFDAQVLKSSEAVQFYCRECSCKLTNKPFRRVLEVPSMDWREVSEHFYGNCCCASFGAQAEFLVARFQELLTPSEATCLVASTTCIVHKGDVIAKEGAAQPLEGGDPSVNISGTDSKLIHVVEDTTLGEETRELRVGASEVSLEGEEESCCPPSTEFSVSKLAEETQKLSVDDSHEGEDSCCFFRKPASTEFSVSKLAEETQKLSVDDSHEGEDSCCSSRKPASTEFSVSKLAEETQKLSVDDSHEGDDSCCSSSKPSSTASPAMKGASPESLGNGFMTGPGSQSEVREWEPFLCWGCSSIVGARSGDGSKKGVQFFKCKISTHESAVDSGNIFRKHTLERLFTHELEKNAESNSSYRYVVRSFQTGAALLQLVLVNQSALVSSGICHPTSEREFLDEASGCEAEERKSHQTLKRKPAIASFQTVAKFMFCDCRKLNSDELRLIDRWAHLQNADDIFMLDEVVGTLVDLLKSHQMAYPTSCQSFQQFGLSFLSK